MTWIEAAPFVAFILAITLFVWVTSRVGWRRPGRPSRLLFMVVLARQRLDDAELDQDDDQDGDDDQGDELAEGSQTG